MRRKLPQKTNFAVRTVESRYCSVSHFACTWQFRQSFSCNGMESSSVLHYNTLQNYDAHDHTLNDCFIHTNKTSLNNSLPQVAIKYCCGLPALCDGKWENHRGQGRQQKHKYDNRHITTWSSLSHLKKSPCQAYGSKRKWQQKQHLPSQNRITNWSLHALKMVRTCSAA